MHNEKAFFNVITCLCVTCNTRTFVYRGLIQCCSSFRNRKTLSHCCIHSSMFYIILSLEDTSATGVCLYVFTVNIELPLSLQTITVLEQ